MHVTTKIAITVTLAAFFAACVTGSSARRGGLSDKEVAALPPNVAEAYSLFAQKCSRCHTLARPLSADIDNIDHWERYVARMRRQAGSGISPADAEEILEFLKYYTEQRVARAKGDGA